MRRLLERALPQDAGIDPSYLKELYQFLSAPEMGLHSFMVVRHGKVVSEGYWAPYGPDKPHTLFSASKSFTALAAGFAVQDGRLSLDDKVVSWFPDRLPSKTCENMEKMTVRHLLMMSTGFAKDPHDFTWSRPDDVVGTGPHCCHKGIEIPQIDWIRNFFDHYVPYEPGTEFAYCTHGSYMLSVIVQRAVGKTVSQYLNEKLFGPLGIGTPSWELSPDGYNVGGWGLMLTTEQLAAVGQFLLNGGKWNGKQILSEEWIREATSVQITMKHLNEPHIAGYGYQIWIDEREGCFLFKGAFGQICAVIPRKDMVIAYTGGSSSESRRVAWEKIWDLAVAPARGQETPQQAPAGAQEAGRQDETLSRLTAALRIPTVSGRPSWEEEKAAQFSGKRYLLGDNRLNFTEISMKFALSPQETDQLTLALSGKPFTVPVGYGEWLRGKTCVRTEDTDTDVSVIFENVSCCGAWDQGKYKMTLCFDETSYINQMEITFVDGAVVIRHERNCSFFPAVNATLTGVEETLL